MTFMTASEIADSIKTAERNPAILEPEFLRPREVYERYRLKRGFLYALMKRGKIRSVVLRERGKMRGVRLVVHESVRDYVLSNELEVAGSEENLTSLPTETVTP